MKFSFSLIFFLPFLVHGQRIQSFNDSWEFVKGIDTVFTTQLLEKNGNTKWEKISLPHTANIEPIQKINQQWQGTCFYRKYFFVPETNKGKHVAIRFDAAMQVADVYLNGKHVLKHLGGYLPFYIDVSDIVNYGAENSILIKLNNQDNPKIPPGKPLKDLDFNYYSGIYRNSWLIVKDKLYISNAVAANQSAGGGVLVHYENVTPTSAIVVVKTEIKNDFKKASKAQVRLTLIDQARKKVTQLLSKKQSVKANDYGTFIESLTISNPQLWLPETPYLYELKVELLQNGNVIDEEVQKIGVKTIRVDKSGFYLNDKKITIRGTNRHQDYPYLGNAVSDNAQYRDAYKIKLAGFNFVRTSHYPQSSSFLNACDELGIMVMDAIPGWQFTGDDEFNKNSFQNIRDMIHRDRNHASIIFWEASLNESGMKKEYMQKAHDIVHEELPFQSVYSAGWINEVYDVFLPARQHAKAPDYWKKYDKEMPLLVAEYGDWEYYAQNAGFNQAAYKDLKEEERTSRQLRGFGEKRLLQQALNYQEAHNDNLYNNALGDVNWLMFDYNRGYAMDIESSGIMDMTRLPKFSFYFYQSQADPVIDGTLFNKPMLFIVNYWQKESTTAIKVFSNCNEVELFLNGESVGKQLPDKDQYSTNLKHPPFTFTVPSFKPGELLAVGYIDGKKVIEQKQQTPEAPSKINFRVDYSGKELKAGQNDVVFVYAEVVDKNGTIVPNFSGAIKFSVEGDAEIIGLSTPTAEAGIATILLKSGSNAGKIKVSACGDNLKCVEMVLISEK
ncbi:MAG TPA: glycoside hydrolase family 2 TIM barrel-domain containing protein [Cyclobacteriaceae bacterium]|nr:glycoside hydrolase family 2 TIM barrel-domain containing protein [Cyclobacteriaceae bacterium]